MAFAFLPSTITAEDASSVKLGGPAAEAITAGYVIRRTSTNTIVIANSEVASEDDILGVAVVTAAVGQPVYYVPPGSFVVVSGLTAGETYFLGGGADEGKVGLRADAVTGTHFASIVGISYSATRLRVLGWNTDVQL